MKKKTKVILSVVSISILGLAGSFVIGYFVRDHFIRNKISELSDDMRKVENECRNIWYDAPDEGDYEAVTQGEIAGEEMKKFKHMREGLETLLREI